MIINFNLQSMMHTYQLSKACYNVMSPRKNIRDYGPGAPFTNMV